MISRKTASAIGDVYQDHFTGSNYICNDALYDFLFEHDYPVWLCNGIRRLGHFAPRQVKDYFMQLHTGETQASLTPNWSWEQRQHLGQQLLPDLAKDILNRDRFGEYSPARSYYEREDKKRNALLACLELDGYVYRDSKLLAPESDVLDARETAGVLQQLYDELGLGEKEVALHCLALSEEHWLKGKWDDCISNARRFLEAVMREVAAAHSLFKTGNEMPRKDYEKAEMVRQYLRREGLLETKEETAIREVYGLLSNTGNHPYIAQKDQARLLRQIALVLSQFVMLRYQGCLASNR
jgi:hypothetical protein